MTALDLVDRAELIPARGGSSASEQLSPNCLPVVSPVRTQCPTMRPMLRGVRIVEAQKAGWSSPTMGFGFIGGSSKMIAYMWNVRRRMKSDEGASAVEYGLLVAAIAAVIVVIVFALGHLVQGKFKSTCDSINTNGGSTVGDSSQCQQ